MNPFLELIPFGLIIVLSYIIFLLKQKLSNAEHLKSENSHLKSQLNQVNENFTSTEKNLNQTIHSLQLSFKQEQDSIKETKKELAEKEKNLTEKFDKLESQLKEETESRKKVLSQKKSSEVRLGSIAETLAPFLDQFEFDPEHCTFLGKPIDYISFAEDEITFIEVKSGKSQLNAKQRHIRDQVKAKLVSWKEIRIK